jgi:hypothetical protein
VHTSLGNCHQALSLLAKLRMPHTPFCGLCSNHEQEYLETAKFAATTALQARYPYPQVRSLSAALYKAGCFRRHSFRCTALISLRCC